jgi:tetratricopeptide (TPR) repeat protein
MNRKDIGTKKVEAAIAGIDSVIALYDEIVKNDPDEIKENPFSFVDDPVYFLWVRKGKLFSMIGKDNEAVECYKKVEARELYDHYFDREQYDEALEYLKTVGIPGTGSTPYEQFIYGLIHKKRYETALDFLQTWQTELDYGFYIFKKGFCLQKSGRFEEAIICYDGFLQNDSSKYNECDK